MTKVYLANILLICVLGTLLLWPNPKFEPPIDQKIRIAYQSVCQITSEDKSAASGVLLESGYVLTAAHVIDKNSNGKLEEKEKTVKLIFPGIKFNTLANTLYCSDLNTGLDIAILKPRRTIPLSGVKLISSDEYWKLNLGAPIYTIGMQSGRPMANITDGRIITLTKGKPNHRNSANSYYGNSGGGVFYKNKLIGIASQVGLGQYRLPVPIYSADPKRRMILRIGTVLVPYQIPLSNQSIHISAPAVREFLKTGKYNKKPLWEKPIKCPYKDYQQAIIYNLGLLLFLLITLKISRKY